MMLLYLTGIVAVADVSLELIGCAEKGCLLKMFTIFGREVVAKGDLFIS